MSWFWYLVLWAVCAFAGSVVVGKYLKHVSDSYPAPDDERDDL